jgi:hypothetical protein
MSSPTSTRADLLSVVVLLIGFLASLGLLAASVAVGMCGLFGAQCSAGDERLIAQLGGASIIVFLAVPVAVSVGRGQARWLLAPIVEVAAVAAIVYLNAVF